MISKIINIMNRPIIDKLIFYIIGCIFLTIKVMNAKIISIGICVPISNPICYRYSRQVCSHLVHLKNLVSASSPERVCTVQK